LEETQALYAANDAHSAICIEKVLGTLTAADSAL
jgi:hypothetical protein